MQYTYDQDSSISSCILKRDQYINMLFHSINPTDFQLKLTRFVIQSIQNDFRELSGDYFWFGEIANWVNFLKLLLINSAENRVPKDLEALANDIPFWPKQTSFHIVSGCHRTVKVGYQHLTKKKGLLVYWLYK